MNKMRFLMIGILLLLTLNIVTLFLLFRMPAVDELAPRDDRRGPADYIIRQLKLDEKQQQQFADLRNQHQKSLRETHKEDERLHDIYFSLIKTDNPDKTKADSIAGLIGLQRKKTELIAFDHFQQLRSICRDDQKKLFDDIIDEIGKMIGGPPPGGRPGPH